MLHSKNPRVGPSGNEESPDSLDENDYFEPKNASLLQDFFDETEEVQKQTESVFLTDSVASYISRISRFALLTKDEEFALSKKILEERNSAAKNKLVTHNLRLVVYLAREYTWSKLSLEDLIQEGNIGLMTAAEKFDYKFGFRFSTMAIAWITQAIRRAIQNKAETIRIPCGIQRIRSRIFSEFGAKLDQPRLLIPSVEIIAKNLDVSEAEVTWALRSTMMKTSSLQEPILDDMTVQDMQEEATLSPDLVLEAHEELLQAGAIIDKMLLAVKDVTDMQKNGDRNLDIFLRYLGFKSEDVTLQDLGDKYSLTRERVRQIISRIFLSLQEDGLHITSEDAEKYLETLRELEVITNTRYSLVRY